MARPTFLLGLGAQKAGTTWLHDYLSVNGLVNFGGTKGVPRARFLFWTGAQGPADAVQKAGAADAGLSPELGRRRSSIGTLVQVLRYSLMGLDLQAYRDHFITLATEHPVVGDITPSYCGLNAKQLQ